MVVALDLKPEAEARLKAQASRAGLSLSDYIQRLLEHASVDGDSQQQPEQHPRADRTSDEIIAEALSEVPPDELRKLPVDLADQHDHYLYGVAPKQR